MGTISRETQSGKSTTELHRYTKERHWTSVIIGDKNADARQIQMACHCPRKLDLMMMMINQY
jgi:hypothetical protein